VASPEIESGLPGSPAGRDWITLPPAGAWQRGAPRRVPNGRRL